MIYFKVLFMDGLVKTAPGKDRVFFCLPGLIGISGAFEPIAWVRRKRSCK
jgi:hypothetical protein